MTDIQEDSLFIVFQKMIDRFGRDLRVSMPAKVLKTYFSEGKKLVDVQPLLFDATVNSENKKEVVKLAPVNRVPVGFYEVGNFMIFLPVAVGDHVELRIQDRCIDELLSSKGENPISPYSSRQHDLTDCVAYPTQFKNESILGTLPDDALLIAHKDQAVEIRIKDNGDLILKGTSIFLGDEAASKPIGDASVIDGRLSAIEAFLASHIHPTPSGPSSPAVGAPSGSASASNKVFFDA